MADAPLRFVHSSDLRIDRPLHGLSHAPDDLREMLRDAPRLAAERVFDTALTENADALLLAGNAIDLKRAAPRDIVFLIDQFRRLDKRNIPVFWAGGTSDPPDAWPRSMPLPDNVTVFPVGRVESHTLNREGKAVACIQGLSKPGDREVDASDFRRDAHASFTVGVAFGTSDAPGKEGDRVDYMALGGRSRRATVDHEPGVAHYAGSPQGRAPCDAGPSGCTVVQVDADGKAKTRFVSTDFVRWQDETIEFTAGVTSVQLRARLRERLDKVRAKSKGTDQLVAWRLHGVGPLLVELRADGLCQELLTDLQEYAGRQQPICWSYSVTCDDPYEPPHEQLDQETILGDLLRQVQVFRHNDAFSLDLKGLLAKPLLDPSLDKVATIENADDRADLYNRAAKLGVALMTEES